MDQVEDLYLDSISQAVMDAWTSGRVALVGDAGYSPGAAVGGGTSLAIIGAYILASELVRASGDHVRGFTAYTSGPSIPWSGAAARLQLSQDAGVGGAAAVAVKGHDRARVGRPVRLSTVSLGHSVIMMWVAALATSKTMRRCVTGPSTGHRAR